MANSIELHAVAASSASSLRHHLLALTDPLQPAILSHVAKVAVWGIIVVLLLPTLALPLGPDQGIFFIVARKLLDGGLLYRDIVDIKPPLIYHMYAGAIWLMGPSAFSIHVLDVLLQLVTCWLLWRLIRGVGGGDLAAAVAIVVYVLILLAGSVQCLGQTESYTGLFGLPILYAITVRRTSGWLVAAGCCAGALVLLKYTFGLALVGTVAYLVLFRDEPRRWSMAGFVLLGWLLSMLALAGYMAIPGVFESYRVVWRFTSAYIADMWQPGAFIKGATSTAVWEMAVEPSLLFTFAAGLGVGLAAGVMGGEGGRTQPLRVVQLLRLSLLFFVLFWASIVIEGRFLLYHFSRYSPFLAPLSAFGLVWIARRIATTTFASSWCVRRLALVALIVVLFYLSPATTALWRTEAVALKGIARLMGWSVLSSVDRDAPYEEAEQVAVHVRSNPPSGRDLMVVSGFSGVIYERCGVVPDYRLMHFEMYMARFAPPEWRRETERFLLDRKPRFVVVQVGGHGFGSSLDALETLRANPLCAAALDGDYREVARTTQLRLYERTAP